jgi:3-hydroxyacyl-[acyl-carrier-protein] dehydratase
MVVQESEIHHYIPQAQPMVMVHALKEVTETRAITQFTIREENIFVEDGYFQEPGLIENMAQTAAVHAGYYNKQSDQEVKIGYIAAIRNLIIHELPVVNSMLETSIEIKNTVLNVIIAESKVYDHGTLLAEAEIRIFNQP